MPYERSKALEERLASLVGLLREGKYSAPTLARELSVSTPTVARCLTALRKRGFRIQAVRESGRWCYRLRGEQQRSKDLS